MKKTLKISANFEISLEIVPRRASFLGTTGSGKSYAAMKMAELIHAAGGQFVVFDPVGIWWGLRLHKDGKSPGLPIPVFGGLHGDIPLEAGAGAMVADLVVDKNLTVVLDVSQFEHEADKHRFSRDFMRRFYFRKSTSKSAVHLFLEEGHEFIPERPVGKEDQAMASAFIRAWKLGRNFGIGGSIITQRPQEVSKRALNLSQIVFAFQTLGKHERKAIVDWCVETSVTENVDQVLTGLENGYCRAWSPAWLRITTTIKFLPRETFDASATPEVGDSPVTAKHLAKVDLERISKEMAATIERAKATDPKALLAKVAELEKELAAKPATVVTHADPDAVKNAEERGFERGLKAAKREFGRFVAKVQEWHDGHVLRVMKPAQAAIDELSVALDRAAEPFAFKETVDELLSAARTAPAAPVPVAAPLRQPVPAARPMPPPSPARVASGNGGLGNGGLRKILIVLAQRNGLSANQVGVRAGVSSAGGSFGTWLSKGRTEGWLEGERGRLSITDAGLAALGSFDPLPEGQDLLNYWIAELGGGAAKILTALAEAYPAKLSKQEIGERAELSHTGGSFGTWLSKLRTLELIEGKGELSASAEFFQ